jgi:ferritin-like metal-binding protein YciE
MDSGQQKIVQYLNEAHATEQALTRVLQSQIAMAPSGSFRTGLETHLKETRDHAKRVAKRLEELDQGRNPLQVVVGATETVFGQVLALSKTPLDLLRGTGGDEKVLKNAKDACATEALEIATYTAIERLARAIGDTKTADLAKSIRADEEKMLDRVLREIPKLTDAVIDGKGFDVASTGAAQATRRAGKATKRTAKRAATRSKTTARKARKVPGVAQAEGQVKGAVASAGDLAIARYDKLTADEITAKLTELSQIDLAKIDSYERKNENRSTVLSRIETLRGDEPWAGYDELSVDEIKTVLAGADDDRVKRTRTYERAHKNRAGVLEVAERELANA